MQPKKSTWPLWLLVFVGAWVAVGTPGIPAISLPSFNTKVTQATFVYEKDTANISGPVSAGLQELNKQGILTGIFEKDVRTGTDTVPAQFKVASEAAKTLPVVVYQAGDSVTRTLAVTKDTTQAEVVEAAR